MSIDSVSGKAKKKRKGKKSSNRITFDEEVVPKSVAEQFTSESSATDANTFKNQFFQTKEHTQVSLSESIDAPQIESKKRKKKKQTNSETSNHHAEDEVMPEEQTEHEEDPADPVSKEGESKRAQKRKKHQQLLQDKKVKVDLVLQQKALNYLSQWKHNRNEWKFEKLRQIWLQQNMFESDRISEEFWETLIEYFNNAKGKVRNVILGEASKIVDAYEPDKEGGDVTNDDVTNNNVKMERARSILQYMQE